MWTEEEREVLREALRDMETLYSVHYDGEPDALAKAAQARTLLQKLDQPAPQGEALDAQAGLAPCPFCGATEPTVEVMIESSYYCVGCNDCGCAHIMDTSRDEAIAAWNQRRTAPDAPALPHANHNERN